MGKPMPDAASVAKKWAARASGAAQEWVDKIGQSTWKIEAIAGEANYNAAMQKVLANKSRSKGIEKSSDSEWQTGAKNSQAIYSQKVTLAEADMMKGIGTVLNDIKTGMGTLAARGPKGSPGNYGRSQKLGEFLHTQAETRSK